MDYAAARTPDFSMLFMNSHCGHVVKSAVVPTHKTCPVCDPNLDLVEFRLTNTWIKLYVQKG
jgi:hypothetical protein